MTTSNICGNCGHDKDVHFSDGCIQPLQAAVNDKPDSKGIDHICPCKKFQPKMIEPNYVIKICRWCGEPWEDHRFSESYCDNNSGNVFEEEPQKKRLGI